MKNLFLFGLIVLLLGTFLFMGCINTGGQSNASNYSENLTKNQTGPSQEELQQQEIAKGPPLPPG